MTKGERIVKAWRKAGGGPEALARRIDRALQPTPHWSRKLRDMGACDEAVLWAQDYPTPAAAWKACPDTSWLRWCTPAPECTCGSGGVIEICPVSLYDTSDPDTFRKTFRRPTFAEVKAWREQE